MARAPYDESGARPRRDLPHAIHPAKSSYDRRVTDLFETIGVMASPSSEDLSKALADTPGLALAVLIGSRAQQTARQDSDWDIAVSWKPMADAFLRLGRHESLRHRLAQCLQLVDDKVDLIDLAVARLAMKALVVEEGKVLHINDELAWVYFQTTTWRELEDYYWDRAHAACATGLSTTT